MADVERLHPLPPAVLGSLPDDRTTGWYGGACPQTGTWLRLPRTRLAEAIAHALMQQLAASPDHDCEGKMYGVLLVKTASGDLFFLKAFSGLLNGSSTRDGWVPPIPGRDRVALAEAKTLEALQAIKHELIYLVELPIRQEYAALQHEFEHERSTLAECHRQRKQNRSRIRAALQGDLENGQVSERLAIALNELDTQSQQDGIERRRLKAKWNDRLNPLEQEIERADARIAELKQQRKRLSRRLQEQFHAVHQITNFAGESQTLQDLMPRGLPTGTGDCCAPKLLHYAATHQLLPLAIAEFWWGPPPAREHRIQGQFYEACAERCQPLMGFLLSGLSAQVLGAIAPEPVEILYEDEWMVAVNKPAGLLSVPGRYGQDSAIAQLQAARGGASLYAVHRLDQETSGVLLLAKDPDTHRSLNRQFQQRQVQKVYEALLAQQLETIPLEISLPLWGDPADRPRQHVDGRRGKPSQTKVRRLRDEERGNRLHTRLELLPITGRTHQLRVHAADLQGLGVPILGDRLYGCTSAATRLHLHARELSFAHPQTHEWIVVSASTPF